MVRGLHWFAGMEVTTMDDKQCQCVDAGCVVTHGPWSRDRQFPCLGPVTCTLYRVDIDDAEGTRFCERCADDAMDSGLFSCDASDADKDAFGEPR